VLALAGCPPAAVRGRPRPTAMGQIDWSVLKDILASIATIIAAIVALRGINTWRNELIGKSQYAVAKKVSSLALQFRDDY
jgi:hypothetical protein